MSVNLLDVTESGESVYVLQPHPDRDTDMSQEVQSESVGWESGSWRDALISAVEHIKMMSTMTMTNEQLRRGGVGCVEVLFGPKPATEIIYS